MDRLPDRLLFIDAEAILIDKPAGMAVHPGPSTPRSLEDHLDELRFGFARRPSPVHRLDRDTSGCLLLARNSRAHRRFARAFEQGEVAKTYLAVIDGVPAASEGRIDLPLVKISSVAAGWRMIVDPRAGKPATTLWEKKAESGGRTLVAFRPQTGRTHQIRVHAAHGLRFPIVGDPIYGDGEGAMLLHAWRLTVPRPPKPAIDGEAPLPPAFAAAGFA